MQKPTLGHIDCPYCGASKTMRVSHDRNGKPFGHCEDCDGQMRVGGKPYRERKFLAMYPWAAGKPAPEPAKIPVTVTEPEPDKEPEPAATSIPVTKTETVPVPTKRKATFADALGLLAGK